MSINNEIPRTQLIPKTPLPSRVWPHLKGLVGYLTRTEVHTYAFSVAANFILSLFPFIVLLFLVARQIFHSTSMTQMVSDMVSYFLPSNQEFVVRNMALLVHPRGQVQIFSIVMLLFSSSNVFMPLELALNHVWGVKQGRSYIRNQLVSLGLALAVGLLAVLSVGLTAAQSKILTFLFMGHTHNFIFSSVAHFFLRIMALFLSISIFFLIYWRLPNRKMPIRVVWPTAVLIGVLWEVAKEVYVRLLPWLDLRSAYGPFAVSVTLMIWAFITGLLLLAGAYSCATRHALAIVEEEDRKDALEQKALEG